MGAMESKALEESVFDSECGNIITMANMYGLQLEVFKSAFTHKEKFKDSSLLECLQVGYAEWYS